MAVEVILPRVDMDMATGKISKWHHRDGDRVVRGAALFEIETDKAAMEIDSPADGILRHIVVNEGNSAPVGTAVAWIYAEGEAVTAPVATAAPVAQAAASLAAPAAAPAASIPAAVTNGEAPRATPLARRLARQAGLTLGAIAGSGPRGRIVAADVRSAGEAKPATITAPAPAVSADSVQKLYAPGSFDVLPVDGMRRTIAARLTESKQTVPHFYLSVTCTLGTLLATRERLNATAPKGPDGKPLWKLSINDFIIKACALALQAVPTANAVWAGDRVLQLKPSDVAVAVAVEGGLFTPVLRDADAKSLSRLSSEMKDLATRAKTKKLAPHEYQGGSFAISNLGMMGIENFDAVINPPHGSILAVGAGVKKPVVMADGTIGVATVMSMTLSVDHRVIDGALGAEFLKAVIEALENPMVMLA